MPLESNSFSSFPLSLSYSQEYVGRGVCARRVRCFSYDRCFASSVFIFGPSVSFRRYDTNPNRDACQRVSSRSSRPFPSWDGRGAGGTGETTGSWRRGSSCFVSLSSSWYRCTRNRRACQPVSSCLSRGGSIHLRFPFFVGGTYVGNAFFFSTRTAFAGAGLPSFSSFFFGTGTKKPNRLGMVFLSYLEAFAADGSQFGASTVTSNLIFLLAISAPSLSCLDPGTRS